MVEDRQEITPAQSPVAVIEKRERVVGVVPLHAVRPVPPRSYRPVSGVHPDRPAADILPAAHARIRPPHLDKFVQRLTVGVSAVRLILSRHIPSQTQPLQIIDRLLGGPRLDPGRIEILNPHDDAPPPPASHQVVDQERPGVSQVQGSRR